MYHAQLDLNSIIYQEVMIRKQCVSDTTNFGHGSLTIVGYGRIRAKVLRQEFNENWNMFINSVPFKHI